jgi:hypothetical protein
VRLTFFFRHPEYILKSCESPGEKTRRKDVPM